MYHQTAISSSTATYAQTTAVTHRGKLLETATTSWPTQHVTQVPHTNLLFATSFHQQRCHRKKTPLEVKKTWGRPMLSVTSFQHQVTQRMQKQDPCTRAISKVKSTAQWPSDSHLTVLCIFLLVLGNLLRRLSSCTGRCRCASTSAQQLVRPRRRKFRSQTSDNMDWWKAEQGRGREKRKIRRAKIREEKESEERRCRCVQR